MTGKAWEHDAARPRSEPIVGGCEAALDIDRVLDGLAHALVLELRILGVHPEPGPVIVERDHELAARRRALLVAGAGFLADRCDVEVARLISEFRSLLVFDDDEMHLREIGLRSRPQRIGRQLDAL